MVRLLQPLEARVLGVLLEKQATVPDTYPLSLNALVAGVNQKTARSPVMGATEAEVLRAIDGLKALALVHEVSGSRVLRYDQNLARVYGVPGAAAALLAVLMLRGPQTAAELRLNAERLHRFADISSVEGFLEELAARSPSRAMRLARAGGEREARWCECLSEEGASAQAAAPRAEPATGAQRAPHASLALAAAAGPAPVPAPAAGTGGLRFLVPEGTRVVHRMRIALRWGDMDAMGHVNNTLYFRYFEIVRLDWLFSIGAGTDAARQGGEGPIIVNAFCNFLRPLAYPGEIEVSLEVANVGRSSFDTYHRIERAGEPGQVWAEGGARVVWTDYRAGRAVPLPEALRARLEA